MHIQPRPIATAEMCKHIASESYTSEHGIFQCTLTLDTGERIVGTRAYGPGAPANAAFASGLSRISALRNLHEHQTQHA